MRLPDLSSPSSATPLPRWPPLLATRGPGGTSSLHAHHAMHFVGCISGELRVQAKAGGPWRRAAGIFTAPDAAHALDAQGADVLFVFLDPESAAGRSIAAALSAPVHLLPPEVVGPLSNDDPTSLMGRGATQWLARATHALGGEAVRPRRAVHPRVRRVLELLSERPDLDADASLEALARRVELSPSRLMHVFTESIGIPLRPYVLWLRLQRAAAEIVAGAPLTQAAHTAGFADSAHMSRTFRKMFGVAPSALRPE
jgi:AraC-like DNA-binding protein